MLGVCEQQCTFFLHHTPSFSCVKALNAVCWDFIEDFGLCLAFENSKNVGAAADRPARTCSSSNAHLNLDSKVSQSS